MGLENRLNKIKDTNDVETIQSSEVAIRIDNRILNVVNSKPFINATSTQGRSLVNNQLNLFYNITLEPKGDQFQVKIDYGNVGTKCKMPIIGVYSAMEAAVIECNTKMRDKMSKGYTIK